MSDHDGSGVDHFSSRSKRNSYGSSHERSTTRDYKERSSRGERGRSSDNNYGYEFDRHRTRGHDRQRDYDQDRERRHRHRMRSRSSEGSRSPSSSRSRTKSKRTSGFDMAPPATTVLPGAAIPGQVLGVPQTTPGVVQNILPFRTAKFSLPLMPAQAMTQQATRHARRVYFGGLPPTANE